MQPMKLALQLAKKAASLGEVPVGAVIVNEDGKVISKAFNSKERLNSPLGHAEVLAIHQAAQKLGNWRLSGCTMYVSHEPCLMCQRVAQEARLSRIVYGSVKTKDLSADSFSIELSPLPQYQAEASQILTEFFETKRSEDFTKFRERTSVILVHGQHLLGFDAADPKTGQKYFFMPGGGVEAGESVPEALSRECLEETGLNVEILLDSHFLREYNFEWNGELIHCKTHFYVGRLKNPNDFDLKYSFKEANNYHFGTRWVDVKMAKDLFNYHPAILGAVEKSLKWHRKSQQRSSK